MGEQRIHERTHAQHIRQRVERADLMKVHLLDRAAVHRALGVQKARIHRFGIFPDRPRKRHGIQKGHDLGRTCAAVRMLCMRRVRALLLPVDGYGDVRTADAALGIRRG